MKYAYPTTLYAQALARLRSQSLRGAALAAAAGRPLPSGPKARCSVQARLLFDLTEEVLAGRAATPPLPVEGLRGLTGDRLASTQALRYLRRQIARAGVAGDKHVALPAPLLRDLVDEAIARRSLQEAPAPAVTVSEELVG